MAKTPATVDQHVREKRRPRVGLALGAGGAKGLAHIGVIEELERRGCEIVAISGSSMGAVIGGIHAAGRLDVYRDWVKGLAKFDVLKLVDWTLSGGGLIKGEKIMGTLRDLIGEIDIQDLSVPYTAVAVDLDRHREVWLSHGPLFDAIRASIAIPSVFRPHRYMGRTLVDGGLLNPVPVTPLLRTSCDAIIAVSVDGPPEEGFTERDLKPEASDNGSQRKRLTELVNWIWPEAEDKPRDRSAFTVLSAALDLMQGNLARLRLAAYQPDLLIELPRNLSATYEFYRAAELIDLGRRHAAAALEDWEPAAPVLPAPGG